jgi:hypothetical protein
MVFLESVLQDLRFSFRAIRRTPLVTSVAVASLALAGCGKSPSAACLRARLRNALVLLQALAEAGPGGTP